MIYIFTPVCSAGPFPQLEDKPLNSKLLLVWEHLKDLLSQSPFFLPTTKRLTVSAV